MRRVLIAFSLSAFTFVVFANASQRAFASAAAGGPPIGYLAQELPGGFSSSAVRPAAAVRSIYSAGWRWAAGTESTRVYAAAFAAAAVLWRAVGAVPCRDLERSSTRRGRRTASFRTSRRCASNRLSACAVKASDEELADEVASSEMLFAGHPSAAIFCRPSWAAATCESVLACVRPLAKEVSVKWRSEKPIQTLHRT